MTSSKRPERANQLLKFLMETKKAYSRQQLAAEMKWPQIAVNRSLPILVKTGVVKVDNTRSPEYFSWIKGSQPNIWPPFEFKDHPQIELDVRTPCEQQLNLSKDYILPAGSLGKHITFAALYGMALNESEYDDWLEAIAAKLRFYYLAYRVILTIQAMPQRDRNPEKWGINLKQHGQDKDDEMNMALAYKQMFKSLLEAVK